nr:reverse transcriptase domain-containing protein [Tanacetum cinerariifolium]
RPQVNQAPVYQAPIPQTQRVSQLDFERYLKANDAVLRNMQSQVVPVSAPMPNLKPSIPYPSRRKNEKRRDQANEQIEKFYEIFKEMSFEISFTDALILMPKFASTLKALIGNKEKLSEMARTTMNEHCLAVILNKLPRKLGTSSSTPAISLEVAELKDMVRALLLDKKNKSPAPTPSTTHAPVKPVESNCVTCGGTLPGNTVTNPKEDLKCITTRSSVAYQGPKTPSPSKQETKVTKDQVKIPSSQNTAPVQPSVIQPQP